MKATTKIEPIKYEDILYRTSGGYDGFMYYHGSVPKICRSPFRRDSRPSFGFFSKEGIYFFKDISTGDTGTLVEYVMKKFGLNFKDSLDKIAWDFGMSTSEKNSQPVKITWDKPKLSEKPARIVTEIQPFKQEHKDFWEGIATEEQCAKYSCFAVKSLAVNRTIIRLKKDEPVFTYRTQEKGREKVYFPERKAQSRFINNVGYFHIWNLENIKNCEKLIVIKSMKDLITVSSLFPCIVATQNESVQLFSEEVVNQLNTLSTNIFVFYGSDLDGVTKCKKITKDFGWHYVNTPSVEDKSINDAYSYARAYGMDKLKEHLHKKGLYEI